MDEQNVAVQSAVETDTTQANPPQAEAQITQEQTIEESAVSEQANDDLPASVEEQRRAFQEQRLEIKRLREEKEVREKSESAFAAFRPKAVPVQNAPIRVEDYADPYTQEVDWTRYNNAVNARLQHAESVAYQASTTTADQIDEFQARQKHPDLFADRDLEQEIADKWFAAKMRGENVTISDVSDRLAKRFEKTVSKAEKIGAEKMLAEVTPKEQAALSASGLTPAPARQVSSQEELERLRLMSRGRGQESLDAIAARLKGVPWNE